MFQKYAPALLNVLFIALVALKTLTLNLGSIEQFVLLIIGAVVTFIVPLTSGKWQGYLKTGTGIVIAVLTALVPLASQGWTLTQAQIITVILAAVTALAVELGVQIRATTTPVDVTPAAVAVPPAV
jgi:hypothetical protein